MSGSNCVKENINKGLPRINREVRNYLERKRIMKRLIINPVAKDSLVEGTNYLGRVIVLFLMFIFPALSFAENVKPLNPECAVCPVVISYEGDEARKILGQEGIKLLLKLKEIDQKTSKIDLDGVRKNGSEFGSDEGYELLVIAYKHKVVINSIQDKSSLTVLTDHEKHEIRLKNDDIRIGKDDDLEMAWAKVKTGKLYEHINGMGMADWNENLSKIIYVALKAVIGS